jgi:hypothetical protein
MVIATIQALALWGCIITSVASFELTIYMPVPVLVVLILDTITTVSPFILVAV